MEDQLAALLPEQVLGDEYQAQKGDGAAEEGADGDAGVDGNAGAEGAHQQVDQDADEDQDDALDEGLLGSLMGANGDALDHFNGGHVGLPPVFCLDKGNNPLIGEGEEGALQGWDFHKAGGAVEEAHDALVFEEMHLSNALGPGVAVLRHTAGVLVHGVYGITRRSALSLYQAVEMHESLLAEGSVSQGTPGLGEEDFFHLAGYSVRLELGG